MYPSARRVLRGAALVALLLTSVVVAALPGTTTASSVPGPSRSPVAATPKPLPVPLAGAPPAARGLQGLSAADRYAEMPDAPPVPRASYFENTQVISLYGHPGIRTMGELGIHSPEGAALLAMRLAREYDALNGDRNAVGALHLIVDTAQYNPQPDNSYLLQFPLERVQEYVDVARSHGILLFLDLQIGWGDPLTHVQRLQSMLTEPFVHIALDPEFSLGVRRKEPGDRIGSLDAARINEVQAYLAELVQARSLPPKILVIHQFLPEMITRTDFIDQRPEVEVTIDMDGFGPQATKIGGYERYAMSTYAERSAIKLFYHWDTPLLSHQQVLGLKKMPDYVIYQ